MHALSQIFPADDFTLLAVVLLLPALGAFVNGVFGKRLGKDAVRLMALVAIGGSFLASLISFFMLWGAAGGEGEGVTRFTFTAWHWVDVGTGAGSATTPIDVKFVVDHLSSVMMLIITGVGFLIHLYATAYMWDDHRADGGFHRFFAYLNLFCFAMLVLVTGASLPIMFVGWEGVGLCSYLLIGFWYSDDQNAAAGKKAFIANRIGDFGLLVAMALLVAYTGSLDFEGVAGGSAGLLERIQIWPIGPGFSTTGFFSFLSQPVRPTVATVVALALFLGCAGKSAQIPLYVWLPDAMAGPTPVSALIHAATMVTAGVYLICRLPIVFLLSPFAMAVVAFVGALTALFAATIGLAQTDIKKVLAYSTVSQLGFMFLGVGVGAFTAGFFHLLTHAFFKACLFLCAGSVIHAMHARVHDGVASQDMRNMGGLAKYMRLTYLTFGASCLAIAGLPLTSGFFSKDEILYHAAVNHIGAAADPVSGVKRWEAGAGFSWLLYVMGLVAATMTAFYMFRALFLTFWGEFRGWKVNPKYVAPEQHGHEHHEEPYSADVEGPEPHESPPPMTVPLMVLAALALVGGIFNPGLITGHFAPLEHWLEPVFSGADGFVKVRDDAAKAGVLAIPGVFAFAIGSVGAYWVYVMQRGAPAKELTEKAPGLYRLVLDKWRIDELYERTVLGMVDSLAETAALFDKWFVDGIIARLTSLLVAFLGTILRAVQTGVVHVYAAVMVVGIAVMGWFFVWRPQATAVVREAQPGHYVVEASPGLGYQYRWRVKSPDKPDSEAWSRRQSVEVDVEPGETKLIKVEVKNAFERTAVGSFVVGTPAASSAAKPTAAVPIGGGVKAQ
jgi:NADH-quinone oxidoreductase subunit L